MANYIWWKDPLFDRSQQDIDFASSKSRLNAADMSRIEGNIGWLADRWRIDLSTKLWQRTGFLTQSHIGRVVQNAQKIRVAFGLQTDSFSTLLFWMDLNVIERLSYDAWLAYINWIDWECFQCKFDTWQDVEDAGIAWGDLENMDCEKSFRWERLEAEFETWQDLEDIGTTWADLQCESEE